MIQARRYLRRLQIHGRIWHVDLDDHPAPGPTDSPHFRVTPGDPRPPVQPSRETLAPPSQSHVFRHRTREWPSGSAIMRAVAPACQRRRRRVPDLQVDRSGARGEPGQVVDRSLAGRPEMRARVRRIRRKVYRTPWPSSDSPMTCMVGSHGHRGAAKVIPSDGSSMVRAAHRAVATSVVEAKSGTAA
jgi:hypothetical protein